MNVFKKLLRMTRYRQRIFGRMGSGNQFAKGVVVSERASIGNRNYFGHGSYIVNARIGNYCSIAPSVMVGPAEHSGTFLTTYNPISSVLSGHEMFGAPAVIGSDVWLGANVVVRQGVTIGDGAIVGANSFVNRDIPPYSIAAGSPARVITKRFDDEVISLLISSRWWDADFDGALAKLRSCMHLVEARD